MEYDFEEEDIKAVKQDPSYFQTLSDKRKTEVVSWEAVFADTKNMKYIPDGGVTYEMIGLVLLKDPALISQIPQKAIDEVLPYVIKDNPDLFKEFPKTSLTPAICMAGVKGYGYNLEFVPESMKTEKLCYEALKASPDLGFEHATILAHVPFPNVCLETLKKFAGAVDSLDLISIVRKEVINDEIAKFAISQDGHCLSVIPIHLQNEDLACLAASTSGNSVLRNWNIRDDIKTENVYRAGLNADLFQSFLYIPKDKREPGLCLTALKWFPEQLAKHPKEIPDKVRDSCNVFTLNNKMEQCTGQKFSIEDIELLYKGVPIKVDNIHTPNGNLKNRMVKFNAESQTFSFSPINIEPKKSMRI